MKTEAQEWQTSLKWLVAVLLAVLLLMFWKVFSPDYTIANNDAPMGLWSSQTYREFTFDSGWSDLNWVGEPLMTSSIGASSLVGEFFYHPFLFPLSILGIGFFYAGLGCLEVRWPHRKLNRGRKFVMALCCWGAVLTVGEMLYLPMSRQQKPGTKRAESGVKTPCAPGFAEIANCSPRSGMGAGQASWRPCEALAAMHLG